MKIIFYIYCAFIFFLSHVVSASETSASKPFVDSEEPARRGYLREVTVKEAVSEFNQRRLRDPIGKTQPPLTEEEVLAVVRREYRMSEYAGNEESKPGSKVLDKISRTCKLPRGAFLEYVTGDYGNDSAKFWDITIWEISFVWGREINPPEKGIWLRKDDAEGGHFTVRQQYIISTLRKN